ncbi:CBS domain-containing protein [Aquirufa rosea]|uniref:CBS domain-containing protein n=1 Tax=Aquirufa rosea TaxID=2509241 RepID=A0A4Q1C079_9BACT|nr:CBS domain-containing protein [Aquirufa rosea]RXK49836.1 CBS domain-containing protein [Aquirufa rosea]
MATKNESLAMLALSYLSVDYPTLTLQDSLQKALKLIQANKVTALSVVDNKKWIGSISATEIEKSISSSAKLKDIQPSFNGDKLELEEDILASLPLFESTGFNLLPVINEEGRWMGYLHQDVLAQMFIHSGLEAKNGGIIRMSFHAQRDSMSVVLRLVEEHKGLMVRSCLHRSEKNPQALPEWIIQVQTDQFARLVKSLERHDIAIEKAFAFGPNEDVDKLRFDLLLKYLNP